METKRICSICGKALSPNAPEGLCPECLLKAGLPTGADLGPDTETGAPRLRFVPPKPEELAPRFPHLEILGLIGQGGMGAVYRARQKQLDRTVALKILPPDVGRSPSFAERFAREAKALAKLNHPGIVTLYEFGQVGGTGLPFGEDARQRIPTHPGETASHLTPDTPHPLYFFLMEFVDGVNLGQLLRAGRLAPKEALAIVPQICDALQYAHDRGIVHRDIKPENILLGREGQVKVADFGIAKLAERGCPSRSGDANAEDLGKPGVGLAGGSAAGETPALRNITDPGKVLGTPQYMAPEQKEHPLEVDHRADIYSLGVVLYQMLTGELPAGKFEPPSRRVQVDVRIDEIVLRALERNPELRYQQASVFKTQVETIAATAEPLEPAPSEVQPAPSVVSLFRQAEAFFSGRHKGMPFLLWLTFTGLGLRATERIYFPGSSLESWVCLLLLAGIYFRSLAAYALTMVLALAGLRAELRLLPDSWIAVGLLAAIVIPLLLSTRWFFPLEMKAFWRRTWHWGTVFLVAGGIVFESTLSDPPYQTVAGTITDAGTGKRIAGASVVSTRPDRPGLDFGKARTDAAGRYRLRTSWKHYRETDQEGLEVYTEPVLMAWAPGYVTNAAVISQSVLIPDSRGVRELDFLLQPAHAGAPAQNSAGTPFIARLPAGAIELVAVSHHPSAGQPWWLPDGSAFTNPPLFTWGGRCPPSADQVAREFVFRLHGLPKDASWPSWKLNPGIDWAGGSAGYAQDEEASELKMLCATLPGSANSASLNVGIATGPWETVAEEQADRSGMSRHSPHGQNWTVSFTPASEFEGNARVTVVHTVKDWEVRVIAVDPNGTEQMPTGLVGRGTDAFSETTATFPLPLKQVARFRFQVRPYHWVEFRNVSLEPGRKTMVEVTQVAAETNARPGAPAAVIVDPKGLIVIPLPDGRWQGIVTFHNNGSVASPAFTVVFSAGPPDPRGHFTSRYTAGPIPAGGTFSEGSLPLALKDSDSELYAVIDPENVLQRPAESVEWILKAPAKGLPAVQRQIEAAFAELKAIKPMANDRNYTLAAGGQKLTGANDDFLRRRTAQEILESGLSCGCGDYAIAFIALMEKRGLETLWVEGAELSLASLKNRFSGHVVVAVRDPAGGAWWLADPTQRAVLSENWDRGDQTFSGKYWIGYAGPFTNYPAHSPEELRAFYDRTLKSIPAEVLNRHLLRLKYTVDASLQGADGSYLNPHLAQFLEMQGRLLDEYGIKPDEEVGIRFVKGGDDATSNLTHSDASGWTCTVGLQSACSFDFLSYLERGVARRR